MKTKRNKPNFRTKQFIEKAKNIHGEDTYDYSLVDYEDATKHVLIFCKKHKNLFKMTPNHHLIGGICPDCREDLVLSKRQIKKEKQSENND